MIKVYEISHGLLDTSYSISSIIKKEEEIVYLVCLRFLNDANKS